MTKAGWLTSINLWTRESRQSLNRMRSMDQAAYQFKILKRLSKTAIKLLKRIKQVKWLSKKKASNLPREYKMPSTILLQSYKTWSRKVLYLFKLYTTTRLKGSDSSSMSSICLRTQSTMICKRAIRESIQKFWSQSSQIRPLKQ